MTTRSLVLYALFGFSENNKHYLDKELMKLILRYFPSEQIVYLLKCCKPDVRFDYLSLKVPVCHAVSVDLPWNNSLLFSNPFAPKYLKDWLKTAKQDVLLPGIYGAVNRIDVKRDYPKIFDHPILQDVYENGISILGSWLYC